MNSGIYEIRNTINGKTYIGSSVNIKYRLITHRSALNRNKHYNKKLQCSWNKYTKNSFVFSVLEFVAIESELIPREQYWIDKLKPQYNICPIAGRTKGIKLSDEQKIKISERLIGNRYAAGKPKIHPQEVKTKISNSLKGIRHSQESYDRGGAKTRGRVGPMLGKKHSEETIQKLIYSHKGQIAWNRGKDHLKGSRHPQAKFTEKDILEIRNKHDNNQSNKMIAKEYNVNYSTIERIVTRITWNHV